MNLTEAVDGRSPVSPLKTPRALARSLGFLEGSTIKDDYTRSTNYSRPFALEKATGNHSLSVYQNRLNRRHSAVTFINLDFGLETPMHWRETMTRYKPLEKHQLTPETLEWMSVDLSSLLQSENWKTRIAQLIEVYKLGESFIKHVLLPEIQANLPDFQHHDNQFALNKNIHIYNNDGRVYTFTLHDTAIWVAHGSAIFDPDTEHPITQDGDSYEIAEYSYGSPIPQLWETKRAWENGVDTCLQQLVEYNQWLST